MKIQLFFTILKKEDKKTFLEQEKKPLFFKSVLQSRNVNNKKMVFNFLTLVI